MMDLRKSTDKLMWKSFGLFTNLHVVAYKATDGKIGHRFVEGSGVCLVNHVGRKSGEQRTTPLIYGRDDETVVLVASKGGHPRNPAWYHNLVANPETEVQIKGERMRVRAREASEGERERLWPKMDEIYSGYESYRERADRDIPILLLVPR